MPPQIARSGVLVASLCLAACAAAPPPVDPPPAPPPAPLASATVEEPHAAPELPADPSIVRCGIDDRPRAIQGTRDDAGEPTSRLAKRAMSSDMAPPAIPVPPRPMPPGVPQPTAPMPRVTTTLGAPRLVGGGAAPASLASAFAGSTLDLDGCEAIATPDDEGGYELSMSLASGGTPLVVRPDAHKAQTPYLRCVMERSCRLRGDDAAKAGDVTVPVAVKWNFAKLRGKAPAVAGTVLPRVFFEARDDANASPLSFYRVLRQLVRQEVRACMSPVDGAEVRVTVTLAKGKQTKITAVKLEDLAPGVPDTTSACVVPRLKGHALGDRPDSLTDADVAVIVAY